MRILKRIFMSILVLSVLGCGDSDDLNQISGQSGGPLTSAPVARNDSYSTRSERTLQVSVQEGLLINDTVNANDPRAVALTLPGVTREGGTLNDLSFGAFTYTPPPGFAGIDTFRYVLANTGGTSTATVTITVSQEPVPPTAEDDAYEALENQTLSVTVAESILDNDSLGVPSEITIDYPATTQAGGVLNSTGNDGSFSYTPMTDFTGPDSFDYTLSNATGSSTATVVITVSPEPMAPTAVDDSYTVVENQILTVSTAAGVLDNDDRGIPSAVTVSYPSVSQENGTITSANDDGGFVYTPAADFTGTDSFDYTLANPSGTSTATVTIIVTEAVTPAWIVDANNGNDATGDYQTASPFQTIQAAIDAAPEGATIIVKLGNYPGPIQLKDGQSLVWDFS